MVEASSPVNIPRVLEDRVVPLDAHTRVAVVAAASHHLGALEVLVRLGWDINMQDGDGNTALHLVAALGRDLHVRNLLLFGSSQLLNNAGKVPLDLALGMDIPESKVILLLIPQGSVLTLEEIELVGHMVCCYVFKSWEVIALLRLSVLHRFLGSLLSGDYHPLLLALLNPSHGPEVLQNLLYLPSIDPSQTDSGSMNVLDRACWLEGGYCDEKDHFLLHQCVTTWQPRYQECISILLASKRIHWELLHSPITARYVAKNFRCLIDPTTGQTVLERYCPGFCARARTALLVFLRWPWYPNRDIRNLLLDYVAAAELSASTGLESSYSCF